MNLDLQSGLLRGTAAIGFRVWGEGGSLRHGPVGLGSCALTNASIEAAGAAWGQSSVLLRPLCCLQVGNEDALTT